ncbi:hypothetical protein DE146DRAFT_39770 [Phaeosphaeria sp. MPI-PUGE-AT-0046c]|nr:hypothetical protein DE146DRAFT_39770 [Phaeosphaeria sp. MPI-PUGE-AT-0046c]
MPPRKPTTIKINLYCPSLSKDIADFPLTTSLPLTTISSTLQRALETPRPVFAYDLKRAPIYDFTALQPGQTLLLASSHFERPLPPARADVQLVQAGPATEAWMRLSAAAKRDEVRDLRRREGDEITYLTLPFHVASARLDAIGSASVSAAVEECVATIRANWDVPMEAVLGFEGLVMPYGELETWEEDLLATLAVLSEATVGQADVVAMLIVEKVKEGGGKVVGTRDVREIGEELYRRGL